MGSLNSVEKKKTYDELLQELEYSRQSLKEYRRRSNMIFNICPVAMIITNAQTGGIIKINHHARWITGIKKSEYGKTIYHQDVFKDRLLTFL
jgi:hypothetical protein